MRHFNFLVVHLNAYNQKHEANKDLYTIHLIIKFFEEPINSQPLLFQIKKASIINKFDHLAIE